MLLVNSVTPDYHSVLPLIVYSMKILRGKQNVCLYATLFAHEQFSAFPWSTSFPGFFPGNEVVPWCKHSN